MKTRMETYMQDTLRDASLEEVMPDFDQNAFWADVEKALPAAKPTRRIAFGRAAKIAAILLLAIGSYFLWPTMEKGSQQAVVLKPVTSASPAANANLQDALPTANMQASIAGKKQAAPLAPLPGSSTIIAKQKNTAAPTFNAVAPIPESLETNRAPEPVTNTVIAKAPPKKVLHYLDLDAEDAPKENAGQMAGPSFIQMKLNKPGMPEHPTQKAPLKEFVLALGK